MQLRGFLKYGQYGRYSLALAHNSAEELFYSASLISALFYKKCSNIAQFLDTDLWCKTKKEEMKIILKYPWKLGGRPFPPQIGALLENHDAVK